MSVARTPLVPALSAILLPRGGGEGPREGAEGGGDRTIPYPDLTPTPEGMGGFLKLTLQRLVSLGLGLGGGQRFRFSGPSEG